MPGANPIKRSRTVPPRQRAHKSTTGCLATRKIFCGRLSEDGCLKLFDLCRALDVAVRSPDGCEGVPGNAVEHTNDFFFQRCEGAHSRVEQHALLAPCHAYLRGLAPAATHRVPFCDEGFRGCSAILKKSKRRLGYGQKWGQNDACGPFAYTRGPFVLASASCAVGVGYGVGGCLAIMRLGL